MLRVMSSATSMTPLHWKPAALCGLRRTICSLVYVSAPMLDVTSPQENGVIVSPMLGKYLLLVEFCLFFSTLKYGLSTCALAERIVRRRCVRSGVSQSLTLSVCGQTSSHSSGRIAPLYVWSL